MMSTTWGLPVYCHGKFVANSCLIPQRVGNYWGVGAFPCSAMANLLPTRVTFPSELATTRGLSVYCHDKFVANSCHIPQRVGNYSGPFRVLPWQICCQLLSHSPASQKLLRAFLCTAIANLTCFDLHAAPDPDMYVLPSQSIASLHRHVQPPPLGSFQI